MIAHSAPLCALASALLFCHRKPELPVEEWLQRVSELEDIALEFEVRSADGETKQLRFAYLAPDEGYVTSDGEGVMWIEGGRVTLQREQGPATVDMEQAESASKAWLDEFYRQLPRSEPPHVRGIGLSFRVWPSAEKDEVSFGANYGRSSGDLFTWLRPLLETDLEVTALEDGFELTSGEELSLQLEPRFGIPRSVWMGSGDERRQALKLVSMAVDEGGEIPPAPEQAEDISDGMSATFWAEGRAVAYTWLLERAELDGIELETRERELAVQSFRTFYAESQAHYIEGWSESLRQGVQDWLAGVREHYERIPQEQRTPEHLQELKRKLAQDGRDSLTASLDKFIDRMSVPSIKDAPEQELEDVLEMEREGARRCLEELLAKPLMDFIREDLESLG